MSSYDFVNWSGRDRLTNIEHNVNNLLKGTSGAAAVTARFSHVGAATVGVGALRLPIVGATTISGVIATANTAPSGAALIFDVNKNGTTIFTTQSNRPSIADGENATLFPAVPDVTALVAGDYLTVDIDQVGVSVAGADIVVVIY